MSAFSTRIRRGLDRTGVVLSTLCVVHCVSGLVLVTVLGLGGGMLLNPRIHEIGLALAVVIGGFGLGMGALRHRRPQVLAAGCAGLALMALGLVVPDGPVEAGITILGVLLLASAHLRNLRHAA
jgi:hypothetical protein